MPMNARLLRPLATGFNPNRIAGLVAWFDTLTPSSYTEASGQISEWRSKVGSLSVAQATGNNRPTLFESSADTQGATRSEINGKQAFYFDGTNDTLLSTGTVGDTQWTAFAACRPQSVSGTRGLLSRDQGAPAVAAQRGPQFLRHASGVSQSVGFSTTAAFVPTAATLTNNTAVILSAVQTASNLQMFVNNAGGTAVSGVQNSSDTALRIGVSSGVSEYWLGSVGEVLLYNRALSATERTTLYDYLRKRWGI